MSLTDGGFIWVGDWHAQKSDLVESRRLRDWIIGKANQFNLPIVFGGDQYNDHGSQRVEVVEFWTETFSMIPYPVVALVGNHDMNHEGDATVMVAHACDSPDGATGRSVKVVSKPAHVLAPGWGAMPFYRKNEDFVAGALKLYGEGVRNILCHQEIDGAKYENGFYAPHGVKMTTLPADLKLISGHIHKQQEFGNVWYPGTPRQLTRSDIGEQKGIWIIAFDGRRKFIPTPPEIVEPFKEFTVTPDTAAQVIPNSLRVYINVTGPKDFVLDYAKKLPQESRVHLRCNPDPDEMVTDIKESEGINVAFAKYLAKYVEVEKLSPELRESVSKRIYELCPTLKRAST